MKTCGNHHKELHTGTFAASFKIAEIGSNLNVLQRVTGEAECGTPWQTAER